MFSNFQIIFIWLHFTQWILLSVLWCESHPCRLPVSVSANLADYLPEWVPTLQTTCQYECQPCRLPASLSANLTDYLPVWVPTLQTTCQSESQPYRLLPVWVPTLQTTCQCECQPCRLPARVSANLIDYLPVWVPTLQTTCQSECQPCRLPASVSANLIDYPPVVSASAKLADCMLQTTNGRLLHKQLMSTGS